MIVLRTVFRRAINIQTRGHGLAHRETADLLGGANIGLDQSGRHGQRPGHIVEAAGIIGRQVLGNINIEIQQIADRIGVFCSIQPMQSPVPAYRVPRCGPVRSQARSRMPGTPPFQDAPDPGEASFRHATFERLFPISRGSARNASDIKGFEGEVCGAGPVVVTFDAIIVDQRTLRCAVLRS